MLSFHLHYLHSKIMHIQLIYNCPFMLTVPFRSTHARTHIYTQHGIHWTYISQFMGMYNSRFYSYKWSNTVAVNYQDDKALTNNTVQMLNGADIIRFFLILIKHSRGPPTWFPRGWIGSIFLLNKIPYCSHVVDYKWRLVMFFF